MNDLAKSKQLLESATKIVEAHPEIFMRLERDPARIIGDVYRLREIWERNSDFRLAQLMVSAAIATQPRLEVFYLEDDALLRDLDNFESQEENGES